jgi:cation diffusion facilitator family transporter
MSANGSVKAVIIALFGNATIGVFKFIVALATNSAGMLAEAIHSFADTTNQVLLLIGSKRSKKVADEQHAFGYGKEEYFWGFMVAVLLFFMGGAYSIYEGIHKIHNPEPIDHVLWIFILLIVSIGIEYKSFSVAFNHFKKDKHNEISWVKLLKKSTDTNIFVILVEDFAALSGLVIVLISTTLAILVNPMFDAIGSIVIGCLLLSTSYFLSNELRKLMIGENISRDMRNEIKDILKSYTTVNHINNIRTMYIGNNDFLLLLSIDIDDGNHVYQVESIVSEMKADIQKVYPNAKYIYIEVE